ncbi:MAG: peptidylprolyl isomerase [Bacteroidetes bacterium]|nr:peptidylprolyl isomerase [Bacteroidota bacterium]
MKNLRKFTLLLSAILLCFSYAEAQDNNQILDEVIAQVGESIILKSDLDKEVYQTESQYPDYKGDIRCEVFDQLLSQKLLLYKADLDSIVVAEDRVEYEINRRIEYFSSKAGGVDKLEQYLGLPILQYKEEMRKKVKEQMLTQEAQNSLIGDLKVSPTEVRKFFEEIPKDSIPLFSAEVEVAQLIVQPVPSKVAEEYARKTAEKIREELIKGKRDFCSTAAIYSKDQGTANDCGNLGEFKRGQMVPEFEAAVFKLKKDSISQVVKTKFGYHIIQLIERKGEIINARHILIAPTILTSDQDKALNKINKIRSDILNDSITWCEAVKLYDLEDYSPGTCGFYTDPNTGSTIIEVIDLDADIALRIEKMKAGDISEPHVVPLMDGSTAYRIIYLKSESEPHQASLEKDYQKLAVYALEKKKQDVLDAWAKEFRKKMYIWIDEKYLSCEDMGDWTN